MMTSCTAPPPGPGELWASRRCHRIFGGRQAQIHRTMGPCGPPEVKAAVQLDHFHPWDACTLVEEDGHLARGPQWL